MDRKIIDGIISAASRGHLTEEEAASLIQGMEAGKEVQSITPPERGMLETGLVHNKNFFIPRRDDVDELRKLQVQYEREYKEQNEGKGVREKIRQVIDLDVNLRRLDYNARHLGSTRGFPPAPPKYVPDTQRSKPKLKGSYGQKFSAQAQELKDMLRSIPTEENAFEIAHKGFTSDDDNDN